MKIKNAIFENKQYFETIGKILSLLTNRTRNRIGTNKWDQ